MNIYLSIILSTTVIYFFLIIALRIIGKRQLAQLSTVDLVFILLLSNAVQNAMVVGDNSLIGGVISAGTLFTWNFVLKYLLYRFDKLDKALQGEPVVLVYKGEVALDNLKKLQLTLQELAEVIREHGIERIEEVDLAIFEKDGNVSVLSKSFQLQSRKKKKVHRIIRETNS